LRDQAQLDNLTATYPSTYFTYEYPSADPSKCNSGTCEDDYHDVRDGAKLFRSHLQNGASIPIQQQLRPRFATPATGTVLLTWDWYWGVEFHRNGVLKRYKTFQPMLGNLGWWTVAVDMEGKIPGNAAGYHEVTVRMQDRPAGMTSSDPYKPTGLGAAPSNTYTLLHGKWMRYWIEIKYLQAPSAFTEWNQAYGVTVGLNPNEDTDADGTVEEGEGRWHMASVWVADETRDVQRVLYRVPVWFIGAGAHRLTAFHYEMNSSAEGKVLTQPLIGYARNFVVLSDYPLPAKDPESDRFLFQRPVR
jgi:hypothetical protein